MDGCSPREGILLSRKRPGSVKKIPVCFFERTTDGNRYTQIFVMESFIIAKPTFGLVVLKMMCYVIYKYPLERGSAYVCESKNMCRAFGLGVDGGNGTGGGADH
jgi:hypothetical protein